LGQQFVIIEGGDFTPLDACGIIQDDDAIAFSFFICNYSATKTPRL